MAEAHVVSALRTKRAELSGHIHDLEKNLSRQRANLASLDATIRLFSPETNPDAIPPKRRYRQSGYFKRHELSRLVLDALRSATGPLTASEIATAVMIAKGLPADDIRLGEIVAERLAPVLRAQVKRGAMTKIGTTKDARWSLAPEPL